MELLPDETFHVVNSSNYDNEKPEWIPLLLTLVEYPQGDLVGKFFAFVSLAPLVIIVAFITLIIFRRDLHTITYFGGIVINECINFVLKHTICEARPMKRASIYTEYGMPSTHAQFMWFFAAYTILFVWIRLRHSTNTTVSETFWRWFIIISSVSSAALVAFSRVYLMYHTGFQVFCGMFLGIVVGVTWFCVTHLLLTPLFPIIVSCFVNTFDAQRDSAKLLAEPCIFLIFLCCISYIYISVLVLLNYF